MSEQNKCEGFSRYESISTEQLQEILRKHAHGELEAELGTEELYEIMEVLSDRRQHPSSDEAFRSDEEALAEFHNIYVPKEREKTVQTLRFPVRFMKVAAAVLAVILIAVAGVSVTADALHMDIWSKFASWTQDIFHFTDGTSSTQATEPAKENHRELVSLHDALAKYTISEKIAPGWLPDGYVSQRLIAKESPKGLTIHAVYENGESELIITIRQMIGTQPSQIEKNEDFLEVYVNNGVEYYIFSNNKTLQAAWCNGEFECVIIGKVPLEEMKAMLDSI